MKHFCIYIFLTAWVLTIGDLIGQERAPIIERDEDGQSTNDLRIIWPTIPGIRYDLQESTDLENWNSVNGQPVKADGLSDRYRFTLSGSSKFFRVARLDDQPQLEGFALIPAGIFTMGSPSDEPGRESGEDQHSVTISKSFLMAAREVTNEQMRALMQWAYDTGKISADSSTVRNLEGNQQVLLDLASSFSLISFTTDLFTVDPGKEDYPCLEVTWYGAVAYANYLGDKEGRERAVDFTDWSIDWESTGYRLPTEAEWEYATRAGTTTAFYTGPITHTGNSPLDPNLDRAGWYFGNSDNPDNPMFFGVGTHPVGQKEPNGWGLHDMHGNAWEWCWDWYGSYDSGAQTDPRGPASGSDRIMRGGSCFNPAWNCRSALRGFRPPSNSGFTVLPGIRLARSLEV